MGVLRHHGRLSAITAFILFFFASISGTIISPTRKLGFGIISNGDKEMKRSGSDGLEVFLMNRRRRLVGPGSSPPICRFKCGRCKPCKAVHVPIQPTISSVPVEYYPEAWRCKCHNKLFVPKIELRNSII